ncbi:6694_t:CDS:1 [Cetraspora pellucida]|uniref:6694_t:CDS:1 n=1 Tax=Cetraspora pellucida TaxID=1433469 RepID=A0ACA9LHB6_9GLOM|nr:6694_t:CDS:1 [Cetraspora pellucida]
MNFQQETKSSTTTSINHIHSVGIINSDSLNISPIHPNTVQVSTILRKRRSTLHILIHSTMQQLLSSPLTSPTSISPPNFVKQDSCSSSSILSNESSYVSFPEFEIYDYNDPEDVNEISVENTFVQMEQFDEMFVNGVRVPSAHLA